MVTSPAAVSSTRSTLASTTPRRSFITITPPTAAPPPLEALMVTSASMVPASVAVTSILPPTSSVMLPVAPSMAACVGVSGPTQA